MDKIQITADGVFNVTFVPLKPSEGLSFPLHLHPFWRLTLALSMLLVLFKGTKISVKAQLRCAKICLSPFLLNSTPSSGQSYKASTIVIYDSRVVPDLKIPHITTLDL